jgi:hypothetical protein
LRKHGQKNVTERIKMLRNLLSAITIATLVSVASAQNVVLTLSSPQDGQVVAPGSTIDWTISFTVSPGDNQGLALLVTDLVQDPNNPESLDIPPADGVPAGMSNFSRPDGITNPPETDPVTGYVGVQRGTAGAMDLLQIGGAQNNFGFALPAGSGVAENDTVVPGVGQSGSQELASGSFTAPSASGMYEFHLASAIANVFTQVNSPPSSSPVVAATVDATAGSITFAVGEACPGDLDGDQDVDLDDLTLLLQNFNSGPGGDIDGDDDTDLDDLTLLLQNFGTSCA